MRIPKLFRRKVKKQVYARDTANSSGKVQRYSDVHFEGSKRILIEREPLIETRKITKKNLWLVLINIAQYIKDHFVLLSFLLLILAATLFLYFSTSVRLFQINEVLVLNMTPENEALTAQVTEFILNEFSHETIFTVSVSEIRGAVLTGVPSVEQIYVRKILPDTLEIELQFKRPLYVVANFEGFAVIGTNDEVAYLENRKQLQLTDFEKSTLQGTADPESLFVKDIYILALEDPEARKTVVWGEVDREEKNALVESVRLKTIESVRSFQEILYNNIRLGYKDLPIFFFYNDKALEELAAGNSYADQVVFSNQLSFDLAAMGLESKNIEWISDYTCRVTLQNEAVLLFLIQRDYAYQITDLQTVLWNSRMEGGKTYDFRTEKYSIY